MNCQCSLPPLQSLHPGWLPPPPRAAAVFLFNFLRVFFNFVCLQIPLILGDLQDNAFFQN